MTGSRAHPQRPTDLPADPHQLLAIARPLAEEVAARLVTSLEGAGPLITSKSTITDLVTELDTWAEAHLVDRLLAARPDDSIVGEEGADVVGSSGVTWSIDPIDGTVNFVHGMPGFNVSIGAQVAGRSVAGVVASPLHHDVFTATVGGGAFRNDRPIRVAEPASVARAVLGTGFGYDPERRRRQSEVLTRVIPQIADIRRVGAAAVDLCSVACGRLDGYWEVGLNPWDHAAGGLIATEAGARVEGLDGEPPSARFVLAAPAGIWDELLALLVEADAAAV
ncbi:MAG: inositol monophosphatase [Acidimicrobiales bacterium]|nr:inositol monophosphatase [Acidimicrobiales bacterium]